MTLEPIPKSQHVHPSTKRVVSYNPSVIPQNSHGSWGLRVTFPKTNSSHLAGSLSKRKLIFQPQCFRCELLASGRVYPTTNDQPTGLFGTFKSFPRTRTRFGRRDRSVITFTSFTACEAHQPKLWNFQKNIRKFWWLISDLHLYQ